MDKIIFCEDRRKGISKLIEIIKEKENQGVYIKKINNVQYQDAICIFEDGERWNVLNVNSRVRGQRCDKAFIDDAIPQEIRDTVISACCRYCEEDSIRIF